MTKVALIKGITGQDGAYVLPALMRKAHQAKITGARSMTVWGSGQPLREFLHVDDLADAAVFLMRHYSGDLPVNVGSGREISIASLAWMIAGIVGFEGGIVFDAARPDGTPRKLADTARLKTLEWDGAPPLQQGIAEAYAAFQAEGAGSGQGTRAPAPASAAGERPVH
jgi:GDP-L-fucose synthase